MNHHRRATIVLLAACLPATGAFAQEAKSTQAASVTSSESEFDPLRFGTPERNVTFEPFIQVDGGDAGSNPDGVFGPDFDRDADIRRARLYTDFTYDDFGGRLTLDFADEEQPLTYLYANYAVTDKLTIQAGQQNEPFSMEELIGSRGATFAEDAQSNGLAPEDTLGLALLYAADNHSLSGGVFAGNLNDDAFDDGVALTGRATYAPIAAESQALHVGLGLTARTGIDSELSYSGGAGSTLVKASLTETENFAAAENSLAANFELAGLFNRFSFQSELTVISVEDDVVGQSLLHGGYAFVSVFLTEDMRSYKASEGVFDRVEPASPVTEGGFGAFELGARLDYLDLTDGGPDAGQQYAISGVANWYLTKRVRVTGNYTRTEISDGPDEGVSVDAGLVRFWYVY